MNKRFTASWVPDSGIEVLFATEERWQAWLDIESALALTEVYQAAQAAASQNLSFPDRLAADHRVTAHLSPSAIDALLDPASHTGISASIAHQQAEVARRFASELHAHLQS